MILNYLPEDAPFSREQRHWLGGFLSALRMKPAVKQPAATGRVMNILIGTQTSNAEYVAERAAKIAASRGYSVRLYELDDVALEALVEMRELIAVVSTYGEGEMPDTAARFWGRLSADDAPRLEGVQFGVIALGDTAYDDFCKAGRDIDRRLAELGATRIADRVDCDVDYDEPSEAWLDKTIQTVGEEVITPTDEAQTQPKGWSRKNPYLSRALENRLLSGANSAKEIRHFAFDLGDSGLTYEAGDALGVMPVNAPHVVDAILKRLGVTFGRPVAGYDLGIGHLLSSTFEIVMPSRNLIGALAERSGHSGLAQAHNASGARLDTFLYGRDTLDLLNLQPGQEIAPEEFISWLKPLQYRAYSISSSSKAHPGEVHLTVAAVRWMRDARQIGGVCSTFLADQVAANAQAGIFVSPNTSFRVPEDPTAPMIMVGPGTGVAPFRAFLEERRETGASGRNWLFFGDRYAQSDHIYSDEMALFQEQGVLHRLDLAFSRDQSEKVYAQHRMMEQADALYGQLQEGGVFYVCGDAEHMAKDVDQALHAVIERAGDMSADRAAEYVSNLKTQKRYLRDVY